MKRSKSSEKPKRRSGDPRFVLGLDLSLTGTGLVVWDTEQNRCRRKRRYKTSPVPPPFASGEPRPRGQLAQDRFVGNDEERINWHKRKILLAIEKYQIGFCVIENHAFGAKGRGKTVLAELHGVIKDMLLEHEIAFVLITPQQAKKHVTGDGSASKMDMIVAARKFDPKISDSDTADAWALAKYGADNYETLVE